MKLPKHRSFSNKHKYRLKFLKFSPHTHALTETGSKVRERLGARACLYNTCRGDWVKWWLIDDRNERNAVHSITNKWIDEKAGLREMRMQKPSQRNVKRMSSGQFVTCKVKMIQDTRWEMKSITKLWCNSKQPVARMNLSGYASCAAPSVTFAPIRKSK